MVETTRTGTRQHELCTIVGLSHMTSHTPVPSRWTYDGGATAEFAGTLRRRLHAWLEERRLNRIIDDVVLAAYEAMANSVEHAYAGAVNPGPLFVTAVHDTRTLTVTIVDTGTWHPPVETPHRGRGLELVAAVADRLAVEHDGDSGTTVTMAWDLASAPGVDG